MARRNARIPDGELHHLEDAIAGAYGIEQDLSTLYDFLETAMDRAKEIMSQLDVAAELTEDEWVLDFILEIKQQVHDLRQLYINYMHNRKEQEKQNREL